MNEQKRSERKHCQLINSVERSDSHWGEKGSKIKMIFQFLFYLTTSYLYRSLCPFSVRPALTNAFKITTPMTLLVHFTHSVFFHYSYFSVANHIIYLLMKVIIVYCLCTPFKCKLHKDRDFTLLFSLIYPQYLLQQCL